MYDISGVSKSAFRQLTLQDIEARLPKTDEGRDAASKIHEELVKFLSLQSCVTNSISNGASNAENKQLESERSFRSESSDDTDEDEPSLFQTKRPTTVIEVSLDSEDDGGDDTPEDRINRNASAQPANTGAENRQSTSRYSLRQRNSARLNYDVS